MNFIISGIVILFFGMALLIISNAIIKNSDYFNSNKCYGQAEVVGYDQGEQTNRHTLLVRILGINDNNVYGCAAGKIIISDYPKGKIVDVIYAPKKSFGIRLKEVHLRNNPPGNRTAIGNVIKKLAWGSVTVGLIMIFAGIITIFFKKEVWLCLKDYFPLVRLFC